jgi:hypothetical protein
LADGKSVREVSRITGLTWRTIDLVRNEACGALTEES